MKKLFSYIIIIMIFAITGCKHDNVNIIDVPITPESDILYAVNLDKKYELFTNYFDKVLLDVPCSNEGLIVLSEPETFEYWSPKKPRSLAQLQKKLVGSAVRMLTPGGSLVYSTCTFSKEENENIVTWALSRFKNMSLLEVKKILPDGLFTGFFAARFVKLE